MYQKFQMKQLKILLFLIIAFILTSCEGLKILALHNSSETKATIIIKPKVEKPHYNTLFGYPSLLMSENSMTGDSSIIILEPDSSLTLFSTFTILLFNVKVKESDLKINYLKITTENDTIVASSKHEILELVKDKRTRYRSRTDKNIGNGRNFGNIFIRK